MKKKFDFKLAGINCTITYLFLSQTNKYIDNIVTSLRNNKTNLPKLSAIFFELQTKILNVFALGALYVCSIIIVYSFYRKYFKFKK